MEVDIGGNSLVSLYEMSGGFATGMDNNYCRMVWVNNWPDRSLWIPFIPLLPLKSGHPFGKAYSW